MTKNIKNQTSFFIDLTLSVSPDMVVWPKSPKTEFYNHKSINKGDSCNNTNLFMNVHSGTHVDAPRHFFENGIAVDELPLERLCGEAFVLDLSCEEKLKVEHFEEKLRKENNIYKLLIKTKNSQNLTQSNGTFKEDYVAIDDAIAKYLVGSNINFIGIDYFSIQPFGVQSMVHKILLEKEIIIAEGLNLYNVGQGYYEMFCLPLKLTAVDGAPARVIIRKITKKHFH